MQPFGKKTIMSKLNNWQLQFISILQLPHTATPFLVQFKRQPPHQIPQASLNHGQPMVGIHMTQYMAASDTDTMQLQTTRTV
jgi:hypothetical protein